MNESSARPAAAFLLGVFIAVGLSIAGIFVARAVESAKRFECFVTVKDLSEREFSADMGIWPVRFRVAANDLKSLEDQIAAGRKNDPRIFDNSRIQGGRDFICASADY